MAVGRYKMPRMKKENTPTSFRLATDVYERLVKFCAESGQPKTVAVERAITMYIDDYDAKMKRLEKEKKLWNYPAISKNGGVKYCLTNSIRDDHTKLGRNKCPTIQLRPHYSWKNQVTDFKVFKQKVHIRFLITRRGEKLDTTGRKW